MSQDSQPAAENGVRLDVWLDVACVFRTRSQAQTACRMGRVEVNGQRVKAHRLVRPGDQLRVDLSGGRQRRLVVRAVAEHHLAKEKARELYEDVTPPPTAEEVELRRLLRLAAPPQREKGAGAPKKRERRQLGRIREGWADE